MTEEELKKLSSAEIAMLKNRLEKYLELVTQVSREKAYNIKDNGRRKET